MAELNFGAWRSGLSAPAHIAPHVLHVLCHCCHTTTITIAITQLHSPPQLPLVPTTHLPAADGGCAQPRLHLPLG